MFGYLPTFAAEFFQYQLGGCIDFIFLADIVLAFTNLAYQSEYLSWSFFCHILSLPPKAPNNPGADTQGNNNNYGSGSVAHIN